MPRRQPPPRAPRQQRASGAADQAAAGTATGAGPAAAAATAAALAATAVPTPGIAAPGVSAAVKQAAATVLEAVDRLYRMRRSELRLYVRGVVEAEMPGAPQDRIGQLIEAETRRELEFQRKARNRLSAKLPVILAEGDPQERARRLGALMEAEKRILGQRAEASAARIVAALEQDLLKQISPDGAFWQLSPLVREHTIGCLAMAGKFWPWKVLESIHPQLHGGCQCRLYGRGEAVKAGLMHPDDAPELGIVPQEAYEEWVGECVVYARLVVLEASRLEEQLAPDEYELAVRELEQVRIMEARHKPRRFAKGLAKGGEFMPERGAERGPLSKATRAVGRQLSLTHMVAPVAPSAPGRDVTIQGQDRRVPRDAHWEERINGTRYTSPAGDTSLYRDGKLIGQSHPDLAPPDDGFARYEPPQANALPPDAVEVAAPPPPPVDGIPDYTGVELHIPEEGSRAGGSTGAQIATDKTGQRWLVKTYKGSQDRVATELLANAIYRAMGAAAANAGVMHGEGDPDFTQIKDVDVGEPPLPEGKGKRISTGIIVREPDGKLWVYEPKGHFGGYEHTFPKGGLEEGLTPQQNAHKELWEETGLHAAITGFVGDFKGDTGTSRYYLATRTGGEPHADDPTPYVKGGSETAAVKLLSPEEAEKALNRGRDKAILRAVLEQPVPEGGQPDAFPAPTKHVALTYPLLDGQVREQKFGKGDSWGGPSRKLGDHFMTDALVGNWDFVGLTRDNVLWRADPNDPNGEAQPVRIDQGGTFQYRAQGQPKPYGPIPTEVWTMRSPKGQGFGTVDVSESGMRDQAQAIGSTLTDARVDQLVNEAPFKDQQMREEVRGALKARVQWMRDFADGSVDLPRPLESQAARDQLTQDQAGLDVLPEEHSAVDEFVHGEAQTVNDHLRSGASKKDTPEGAGPIIKGLDSLLKRTRLDDDVYGYVPFDAEKFGGPEQLQGRTLRDDGYAVAALTASTLRGAPGYARVMIPAGSRALYSGGLEGLEDAPDSAAMIMPRGARMRVVRFTTEGGKLVPELVVMPS